MQDQHRFNTRAWLLWTAGFVAFIVGGVLAMAATGRINDAGSALLGGMIAGAVIGTGQWLVGRRLLGEPQAWIGATALAMGLGLLVGAWAVGYGTSLGELALMGAITGIPIGAAQAYLLRDRLANAWVWAAAMPLLWALGWTGCAPPPAQPRRRPCTRPRPGRWPGSHPEQRVAGTGRTRRRRDRREHGPPVPAGHR